MHDYNHLHLTQSSEYLCCSFCKPPRARPSSRSCTLSPEWVTPHLEPGRTAPRVKWRWRSPPHGHRLQRMPFWSPHCSKILGQRQKAKIQHTHTDAHGHERRCQVSAEMIAQCLDGEKRGGNPSEASLDELMDRAVLWLHKSNGLWNPGVQKLWFFWQIFKT